MDGRSTNNKEDKMATWYLTTIDPAISDIELGTSQSEATQAMRTELAYGEDDLATLLSGRYLETPQGSWRLAVDWPDGCWYPTPQGGWSAV